MMMSAVVLSALGLGLADAPAQQGVGAYPARESSIAQIEGLSFELPEELVQMKNSPLTQPKPLPHQDHQTRVRDNLLRWPQAPSPVIFPVSPRPPVSSRSTRRSMAVRG